MSIDSKQCAMHFVDLISASGLYPTRGITYKEVIAELDVSEAEAKETLKWAVLNGLLTPVYNELSTDTLYQFDAHLALKGTRAEVDPRKLDLIRSLDFPAGASLIAFSKRNGSFDFGKRDSNACILLADGRAFVRGVGYFPQSFFREAT